MREKEVGNRKGRQCRKLQASDRARASGQKPVYQPCLGGPTSLAGVGSLEHLLEQSQRAVEGRKPLLLLAAQLQEDAVQPGSTGRCGFSTSSPPQLAASPSLTWESPTPLSHPCLVLASVCRPHLCP